MTYEEVKNLIATNEFFVATALKLLYGEQTDDEQESEMTENQNGRGFNATDAPYCTSVAKQLIAGKELTYKQIESLRKILPKYSRQISVLWKK